MKICVLQPDYSTSKVDYRHYDPPRNLAHLCPDDQVDHVFLNKLTTYQQIKGLSQSGYDIFVNLCEGYLEWDIPSIDVIHALDLLQLPYTGPTATLYDPSKTLMKYVAYCAGVATPASVLVQGRYNLEAVMQQHGFPLFVKPAKAGDSLGIDEDSLVHSLESLEAKVGSLAKQYPEILIEKYIAGREYTVLVVANADGKSCTAFQPIEYQFQGSSPFKTYALKTSDLHPTANVPCTDPSIKSQLTTAAEKIFDGFGGVGYARLDFRLDEGGTLYFLEINFCCSVFYDEGYEGSADYILQFDPVGKSGFLRLIIAEGIARHERQQKKYTLRGDAVSGYGIFAKEDLSAGTVIFRGEEKAQRIVTKSHVEATWTAAAQKDFRHYAYPISPEVYLLWDENPANWAPQNHACNANCGYVGLNVVALRPIRKGEELTLDYATFLDETIEPFTCHCGASNCRGIISGTKGNRITAHQK